MPPASFARRRAGVSLISLLAGLAALSGCGSSGEDVASKSASQILAAATSAAQGASSVHVESRLGQGLLHYTMTADLASSHGARQRSSLGRTTYAVIVSGDTVYLAGSPFIYRQLGAAGARLRAGTWLKGSATSGPLAALASNASQNKLLAHLLASTGSVSKGATTTMHGHSVVELKETGRRLSAGSIYIATTGKPYPIEVVKRGREHGTITFSRWNEPVSLSPPASAVDINELRSPGH